MTSFSWSKSYYQISTKTTGTFNENYVVVENQNFIYHIDRKEFERLLGKKKYPKGTEFIQEVEAQYVLKVKKKK